MGPLDIDKYKNRTFNIGIVLLAVIIALGIYNKQARQIQSLKDTKEMETKKNVLLDDIGKLEKEVDAYKELLKNKNTELVIGSISDMAKESGVKIISIKPEMVQKYQDYMKFPFSLVVNSFEYHALGVFISKIESHPDVYIIEDVRINPQGGTGGLTVNLKLSGIEFAK